MIYILIFLLFSTHNSYALEEQAQVNPEEFIAWMKDKYESFIQKTGHITTPQPNAFYDDVFNLTKTIFSELAKFPPHASHLQQQEVGDILNNILYKDADYIYEIPPARTYHSGKFIEFLMMYKNVPSLNRYYTALFKFDFIIRQTLKKIIVRCIQNNQLEAGKQAIILLYDHINLFSTLERQSFHNQLLVPLAEKYKRNRDYTQALALLQLALKDTQPFFYHDFKNIVSSIFETIFTITNSASTVADLELPAKVLTDIVASSKMDIKFKQEAQGYLLEIAQFYVNKEDNDKALTILDPLIHKQKSILPEHKAYAQRLMRQIQTEPSVKKQKN